ncbi:MAG: sulfotransferase [Planctomycetales bacterium]|nr:sulfotransferase [Planctomycetales bacterium]
MREITPSTTGLYETAVLAAVQAHQIGQTEEALRLAARCMRMSDGLDFGGHVVVTEVLYQAGRVDELDEFLKTSGEFQSDPRCQIMIARVQRVRKQWTECEETLRRLLATSLSDPLKRICGFELSKCLDAQGRYTESWQAAATAHRETAQPFAIDLLIAALKMTAEISTSELLKIRRASAGIPKTACILGMPRSGTSVLEQMLDSHSQIVGRGESGLPGEIGDAIAKQGGGWPVGVLNVTVDALNQLQALYRDSLRTAVNIPDDIWTIDKTVFPQMQPLVIACVLPDTKVIRIVRDARDNAVSLFLNNLAPSWGWTASLNSISKLLQAERQYVPIICEKLKLDVISLEFEALVAAPEETLRLVLEHLGLPWEAACLRPDLNPRIVQTLSNEQVRRPLNANGIGRWQNYAEQFEASWGALT